MRNAASPYEVIDVRWEATSTSAVTLDFSTAPASNSVRVGVYNAVAGSTVTIGSIDDLGDVTISSAADGDFLRWNGTAWINDAVNLSTDTIGAYVQSLVAGTGISLSGNSGEGATPTVTVDTDVIQARVSGVSDTEIGYLDGVTSAIQTQLNAKSATLTDAIIIAGIGGDGSNGQAIVTDGAGALSFSTIIGTTEASIVSAVGADGTSGQVLKTNGSGDLSFGDVAQAQVSGLSTSLGLKADLASPTFTGTVSGVTATMVGLGNVDDTSDTAKPVSTATQTALNLKSNSADPTFTGTVVLPSTTSIGTITATELGYVDGVTSAIQTQLDSKSATLTDAIIIAGVGIDGTSGQAIVTDGAGSLSFQTIVGTTDASIISAAGGDGDSGQVLKTNGLGDLSFGDVAEAQVTGLTTALGLKAPLASPDLTGTPTAPTASVGTNTTQLSTTEFVRTEVAALVASSPAALDTLNELALALGSDPNFATTVTNSLALKAPIESPTFTGTVTLPNGTITTAMLADGAAKAGFNSTLNVQTGTTYTLVLSDLAKLITIDHADPMTLTIPHDSSVDFAIGDRIDVLRKGAGELTIAPGAGVIVNATPGFLLRAQWSSATLVKLATDMWVIIGDLKA